MRSVIVLGVLAALLLAGGCGSDPESSGQPGAEGSFVGEASPDGGDGEGGDDGDGEEGPDEPVDGGDQGSAELPTLPIGGSVPSEPFDGVGSARCGTLAWGGESLPSGVAIMISDLTLPTGVSVTDGVCPGSSPPCLGGISFTADSITCEVGLLLEGPGTDEEPSISASGGAVCESQEVCDQLGSTEFDPGATAFVDIPFVEDETAPEDGTVTDDGSQ